MTLAGAGLLSIVSMLGSVGIAFATTLRRPHTFRVTSAIHQLDRVGLQAVPIIVLITFLIGGIIAQQGFFHFRKFEAELSMAALYGGCVISWLYGGMSSEIFIARLHEAISTTHFKVGMLKAPFMNAQHLSKRL